MFFYSTFKIDRDAGIKSVVGAAEDVEVVHGDIIRGKILRS